MKEMVLEVRKNDEGRRLDRVVRIALPDMPLSAIFRALRKGGILVNGEPGSPDYRCRAGDRIVCRGIDVDSRKIAGTRGKTRADANPGTGAVSDLRALVLDETPDLLFVNKPMGMLVHGGDDSLDSLVKSYLEPKLEPSLAFAPGPLHRLDRNTSGVIVFSKSYAGAREFSAAMRAHKVAKTYLAVLEGSLETSEQWNDILSRDETNKTSGRADASGQRGRAAPTQPKPLALPNRQVQSGRSFQMAESTVIPIRCGSGKTLALFRLQTGRTHQIRAQSSLRGHPLTGDIKYGAMRTSFPYYLHALKMELHFDTLQGCPRAVLAPLPDYFLKIVMRLFHLSEEEVYSSLDAAVDDD